MTDQSREENPRTKSYASVREVPTDVLANRFVGSLILAKGNLLAYEALTANLIRELRGEPHPQRSENANAESK